jgi:hypothetical protein
MRRYKKFSDLVALFVNTVVFEYRSAPSSAFRSLRRTAGGTPQSRALRRSRYGPLDTSPYLRTEPLEILQYVFSQKIFCALPVAPPVPLGPLRTITRAISGLSGLYEILSGEYQFVIHYITAPSQKKQQFPDLPNHFMPFRTMG